MRRRINGFHDNKQVREAIAIGHAAKRRDVTVRWAWSAHVIGC